jgi:hypothetical protein
MEKVKPMTNREIRDFLNTLSEDQLDKIPQTVPTDEGEPSYNVMVETFAEDQYIDDEYPEHGFDSKAELEKGIEDGESFDDRFSKIHNAGDVFWWLLI